MKKEEMGHNFLARLGKTRLRPGGRKATEWLIANGDFNANKKVLEVACNMGTTAIDLASKFGCHIEGVDLDENALEKARKNIAEKGLQDKIHVQRANAMKLPFADNSFDIVINEAMLTMLPVEAKIKAVREYYRVLKPNGFLLTHDVMLTTDNAEEVIQQLRDAINVTVTPLSKQGWKSVFLDAGFRNVETYSGDMTLLSPTGMIYDEGILGTAKIIRNALKAENRPTFKKMFKVFNDPNKQLYFIALCSQK
ncbi:class I SAM-dependent methyltransferase [Avibacterium sp. 21-586]|uniref:class I SAM-dependent methyltransferase n=1 Tax=Avibacterium sp. 21-586 TaxID=2911534 RepID=UPI00224684DF|nr:class I SAM-dependent methyltransferase [Avibacterium sp. 21-586]MCW9711067.1 class I SAM-dependent methyltransferase [Avibacterium sp. 21-586]